MAKTTKQQVIENLTELMAKVQQAYFAGKMFGHPLWVHEDSRYVSIDLYHFMGDGLPVCEGLRPCVLELADGRKKKVAEVFCMSFYEDDACLTFLVSPEEDAPDYDVTPEVIPEQVLENVLVWLKGQIELGENNGYRIL